MVHFRGEGTRECQRDLAVSGVFSNAELPYFVVGYSESSQRTSLGARTACVVDAFYMPFSVGSLLGKLVQGSHPSWVSTRTDWHGGAELGNNQRRDSIFLHRGETESEEKLEKDLRFAPKTHLWVDNCAKFWRTAEVPGVYAEEWK